LDGRFMKLDAGDPIFFEAIDRPLKGVSWGNVISGLTRLRNLTLQSMFVEGRVENTNEKSVSDWISAVGYIRPNAVQIYSLERPPSDERVLAVSRDRLQGIGERLKRQTGVEFSVF
jgi:wyosine [tRNA(Phe)-imidazoG37] synthetase (radical SAM superfamily)